MSCALTGCADKPKVIAPVNSVQMTVADATHVYWRSYGSKTIERCTISDCSAAEFLAFEAPQDPYQNLALDDAWVYWITNDGVYRRRK